MYLVDSVFPAPLSPEKKKRIEKGEGKGESERDGGTETQREGGRGERATDINQAHCKHSQFVSHR